MRRDRLRGLEARRRGHRRHDDVGVRDRIGRRRGEPRADRLARLLELRAFVARKQDVPRRDAGHAGLAQAGGDRLSGFAEADEAEAGRVSQRHLLCLTRRATSGSSRRMCDRCALADARCGAYERSNERGGYIVLRSLAIVGWCVALMAPAASQATYPDRPIRLVVGFPAGGPTDGPARVLAEKLRVSLGQPVVVENKPGAGGKIAVDYILAQPRDGYTLLLCTYIDAINTVLYKKSSYQLSDIAPISLITNAFYAVAVAKNVPGEHDGRADRLREGAAGRTELRPCRCGIGARTGDQAVRAGRRRADDRHSLQGHGRCAAGNGGRAAAVRNRSADHRDAAVRGRQDQGARHDQRAAARRSARQCRP